MGFFNSKSWDNAFNVLDSIVDEVSNGIKKQTQKANSYWEDNKGNIYASLNNTSDFIDNSFVQGKDLAIKTYRHIKNYVIEVVNQIVDILFIKEKVQERRPDALKLLILKKKRNSVNVGIFNEYGNMDQSITINSDYGISNNVYKGQVVNL